MQKIGLYQSLQQKLSPQQIQFIKLLEVPTSELESRIEEELEINPALEDQSLREGSDEPKDNNENGEDSNQDLNQDLNAESETEDGLFGDGSEDISLGEYLDGDDIQGYKMYGDGPGFDEDDKDMPLKSESSLIDSLMMQLGFLKLNEVQLQIAQQLIGSIDEDGYIRRDLGAIVNDMAFTQNLMTDEEEVESILFKIQDFDPAGIAARNLQECLALQLKRKDHHLPEVLHAIDIIDHCFEEFSRKHYDKITKKLNIEDAQLKLAIKVITKCNPKPGGVETHEVKSQYIIPDYMLHNNQGQLELSLNSRNAPDLKVSYQYLEMFDTYEKGAKNDKKLKEAVSFVKHKLDSARWFIDAIKQRQNTLMQTMRAILALQYEFFLEGDESKLRPMILKDVADKIQMDISTVSRVASSKTIQTEFGVFPLKYFFSEGISTESGEDVSSREVKKMLSDMVAAEDKAKPLADEDLEKKLREMGYNIARRTVAKYREQMHIPVARLRKEM